MNASDQSHHASEDELLRSIDRPDAGNLSMVDLSGPARETIRTFIADSTAKGGASPADVADLYTAPEIVADPGATRYLDVRFVRGELPGDWRDLQDELADAQLDAPVGAAGSELLARLQSRERAGRPPRSIFDDPEDLDEEIEDHTARMPDRAPTLGDLGEWARRSIERSIVVEVMSYGVPPATKMRLREELEAAGDERAIQYLDLPFEIGTLPDDWDELRDLALRVRSAIESRGEDPTATFGRAEASHTDLDTRGILARLEDRRPLG